MTTVSVAAYAALHGVTKQAAYKWRDAGLLVLVDGKVDVEASDVRLAKYRDPQTVQATRSARKPPPQAPAPPQAPPADWPPRPPAGVEPANIPVAPPGRTESPEQAAERIVSTLGADLSTEEARRVKENYLALRGKLEYERDSGELVDVKTAQSVLFEEFRAVRNAWLAWPANYAAEIAADLGVEADRATEVLAAYVHRQVAALGEPNGRIGQG